MSSAPLIFQASPSYFPRETRLSATHCSRSVHQGSSTPITERRRTIPLEYLQQFRYSTVSRRTRREAIGPLAETTWRKRKCGLLSCGLVKALLGNAPAAPSAAAHAPPRSVECESDGNASWSITGFWQSLEGLCSDGTVGRTMYRAALGVASNQLDCYRVGLKSKEENRTGTF
jgi:hypothetical protein